MYRVTMSVLTLQGRLFIICGAINKNKKPEELCRTSDCLILFYNEYRDVRSFSNFMAYATQDEFFLIFGFSVT